MGTIRKFESESETTYQTNSRSHQLLTVMFHTGTANPRLKMNANEMHEELLKRVADGEISKDDVPRISTISNWITNTSRSFKKTMALRLLEEAESSEK